MSGKKITHHPRLPDPKRCRTMYLEQFPELSKCLVADPDECEFAARIGSGVYCHHPHRFKFENSSRRHAA
jgi:hypothetical protein